MNFDRFSKSYREIHTENIKISGAPSEYYAEFKAHNINEFVLNHFVNRNTVKLLDFGCGDGLVSSFLSQLNRNYKISCIDPSAESINEAIRNYQNKKNLEFRVQGKDKIPYNDSEFDVVFAINVFHHIEENELLMWTKEIIRVLKTDGYIIVIEHNPSNPLTRYFVKTCVFDDDAILISANQLINKLNNLGIKKYNLVYQLFLPRWKILRNFLFLEKLFKNVPIGGQYMYIGENSK